MDARERESIELGLSSSDEELRRLAVESLAGLPPEEALPRLVERLGDPSWRVRKAAVERFVHAPEAWVAARSLIAALADGENPGRRNSAVEALVRCGARVVPPLLEASASPDVDVRKLVVDALAGIGDERALPRLLVLLADPDANVRAAAADGLGATGGAAPVEALVRTAVRSDEDRLVRFSALRALGRLEPPLRARDLVGALEDPWLRPVAFAALGAADDDEAEHHFLKGLAAGTRPVREAAMEALLRRLSRVDGVAADRLVERAREAVAASPGLVADAIERLRTADLATRLVLVQFLGLLRRSETVVPVLRAGCDEALAEVALASLEAVGNAAERAIDAAFAELDTPARRLACVLLGRTQGLCGGTRLVSALDDPQPEIRSAAAAALGRRGGAQVLPALVRRLEAAAAEDDPDLEEEVGAVVSALVALAQPAGALDPTVADETVSLLGARLEGADESVRLAIATVLGRVGRPQDAQLVTFLLKDESDRVRRAAVEALARLEPGEAPEPVRLALADESPLVRVAAANALGASTSPRACDDLGRLAEDGDPWVRAAALRALGAHAVRMGGASEAVLLLLERATGDEGPVAMAAVAALATIGGPVAVRVSQGLLGRAEPELVQAALGCVGQHGDATALEWVLPLVSHDHWSVRAEAISTLAERGMGKAVPSILRRLEIEQDDFVRDAILRALSRLGA